MALIVCPECGKEISESAKNCPYCGYPLKSEKAQQVLVLLKEKKKIVVGFAFCAIIFLVFLYVQSISLNKYEKMALEDCETLIQWLKNPESFVLYDDILIYPDKENYGDLVYINYGGTNSYGGMVSATSVFKNGTQYVGDYGEDKNDFSSEHEYNQYLLAFLPYELEVVINENYENFIIVDADKIMKNLD